MTEMSMIRPFLFAQDIIATQTFYESIGFKKVFQVPDNGTPLMIEMEFDRCKMMFLQQESEEPTAISGMLQFSVSNLREFQASLPAHVSTGDIEDDHGHGWLLCIRDPNGYALQFREPLDQYKKYFGLTAADNDVNWTS